MIGKSYYRHIRKLIAKFPRNRVYEFEIDRPRARELMRHYIPGPLSHSRGMRCYRINQPVPIEITKTFPPDELATLRAWWIYLRRDWIGTPFTMELSSPTPDETWLKNNTTHIELSGYFLPHGIRINSQSHRKTEQ